jgi:hypothetical protein
MNFRIDTVISFKIRNIMDLSLIDEISKVRNAKRALAESIDELRTFTKLSGNTLIVCDLSVLSVEETKEISNIAKDANLTTFGFYPHISDQFRVTAKTLGFNFIVPRSAFRAKLNLVLA